MDAIGTKIKYVFFDAGKAERQEQGGGGGGDGRNINNILAGQRNSRIPDEERNFQMLALARGFEHLIEKRPSATHLTINNLFFFANLQDVNAERNDSVKGLAIHNAFILPPGLERIAKAPLPN